MGTEPSTASGTDDDEQDETTTEKLFSGQQESDVVGEAGETLQPRGVTVIAEPLKRMTPSYSSPVRCSRRLMRTMPLTVSTTTSWTSHRSRPLATSRRRHSPCWTTNWVLATLRRKALPTVTFALTPPTKPMNTCCFPKASSRSTHHAPHGSTTWSKSDYTASITQDARSIRTATHHLTITM